MKGKDFFNNLRETDNGDFDFSVTTQQQAEKTPRTTQDVVKKLGITNDSNNINVTVTLNKDLFDKIEQIQNQIQKQNKNKISKSRIIAKICEQYLAGIDCK